MAKAIAAVQTPSDGGNKVVGYIIIVAALALVCVGVYVVYTQMKGAPNAGAGAASNPGSPASGSGAAIIPTKTTTTTGAKYVYSEFPLTSGSTGQKVKDIQHYLNSTYSAGLTEDGIWGSKTAAACMKYLSVSSVSQAEYNSVMGGSDTPAADASSTAVPASSSMADNVTDFTNATKAPWAAWLADQGGFSISDNPSVSAGATLILYDTNLKTIGTTTNPATAIMGYIWGLTTGYAVIALDQAYVDSPNYGGASFVGVKYSDLGSGGISGALTSAGRFLKII